MNATAEAYIASVLEQMPRDTPLREQIAVELRGHIAERLEAGQELAEVLHQLGDPEKLAESYLSAVPLESASAGERIGAKLIDAAVCELALIPILVLCAFIAPPQVPRFTLFLVISLVGGCLLMGLYTVIAESTADHTVGKRMVGLRVVRESGARISFGQAVVRQLSLVFQVIWVDALFALFTARHQRAFEMLSQTRVVRVPRREPVASH